VWKEATERQRRVALLENVLMGKEDLTLDKIMQEAKNDKFRRLKDGSGDEFDMNLFLQQNRDSLNATNQALLQQVAAKNDTSSSSSPPQTKK